MPGGNPTVPNQHRDIDPGIGNTGAYGNLRPGVFETLLLFEAELAVEVNRSLQVSDRQTRVVDAVPNRHGISPQGFRLLTQRGRRAESRPRSFSTHLCPAWF